MRLNHVTEILKNNFLMSSRFYMPSLLMDVRFKLIFWNYYSLFCLFSSILLENCPISFLKLLSDSTNFQATNFWVDFNAKFSAYKAYVVFVIFLAIFGRRSDCYYLLLFSWHSKTPVLNCDIGGEIAVSSDFLWAVSKKLGIIFIAITQGVGAISPKKST